jgi:hypothetical protein
MAGEKLQNRPGPVGVDQLLPPTLPEQLQPLHWCRNAAAAAAAERILYTHRPTAPAHCLDYIFFFGQRFSHFGHQNALFGQTPFLFGQLRRSVFRLSLCVSAS